MHYILMEKFCSISNTQCVAFSARIRVYYIVLDVQIVSCRCYCMARNWRVCDCMSSCKFSEQQQPEQQVFWLRALRRKSSALTPQQSIMEWLCILLRTGRACVLACVYVCLWGGNGFNDDERFIRMRAPERAGRQCSKHCQHTPDRTVNGATHE